MDKSKFVFVKLGGNLGAMISTKPEPVNIITLGNPVTVCKFGQKRIRFSRSCGFVKIFRDI